MSRLGASPGFVTAEPGLAPKRLTLKLQIALNQQARRTSEELKLPPKADDVD